MGFSWTDVWQDVFGKDRNIPTVWVPVKQHSSVTAHFCSGCIIDKIKIHSHKTLTFLWHQLHMQLYRESDFDTHTAVAGVYIVKWGIRAIVRTLRWNFENEVTVFVGKKSLHYQNKDVILLEKDMILLEQSPNS